MVVAERFHCSINYWCIEAKDGVWPPFDVSSFDIFIWNALFSYPFEHSIRDTRFVHMSYVEICIVSLQLNEPTDV